MIFNPYGWGYGGIGYVPVARQPAQQQAPTPKSAIKEPSYNGAGSMGATASAVGSSVAQGAPSDVVSGNVSKGGIVGAMLGFSMGGLPGAALGYGIGKQAGALSGPSPSDFGIGGSYGPVGIAGPVGPSVGGFTAAAQGANADPFGIGIGTQSGGYTADQINASNTDSVGFNAMDPDSTVNDNVAAGGGSADASGKIVCTAMNDAYGFGSFRQKIWLKQSANLDPAYQRGYHKIFLPLVRKAYKGNSKVLRSILEHIARHRTADIWAEMRGSKRDIIGRLERSILEPICFIVGKVCK